MAHPRSPLLNVMTAAAQKAGRKLIRDFGEVEHLQVSQKGPADFVSNADHKSEKILREELQKARPKFGMLLEDISNCWVVDPLDGTTNFLHGIPHFSISVALVRDGVPFAGVVYEPIHDEMYWAEKGSGAFVNGRRLRVSGRKEMSESVFSTGIPFFGAKDHPQFLKELESVMAISAGVRRFGSAALDLAYVAAGRYDGFWETELKAWDIAAGIVLVREAGGLVSEIDGGKNMLTSGNILAANSPLHPPLGKILRNAGKTSK
jgi:myo-inositol-1(or 4)-monophosphatase